MGKEKTKKESSLFEQNQWEAEIVKTQLEATFHNQLLDRWDELETIEVREYLRRHSQEYQRIFRYFVAEGAIGVAATAELITLIALGHEKFQVLIYIVVVVGFMMGTRFLYPTLFRDYHRHSLERNALLQELHKLEFTLPPFLNVDEADGFLKRAAKFISEQENQKIQSVNDSLMNQEQNVSIGDDGEIVISDLPSKLSDSEKASNLPKS